MTVLVVSGTGTGVGKTVVTAAIAALACSAGRSVAVVKPVQTGTAKGEAGDLDEVHRLTGVTDLHEFTRFPEPLSPAAAARVSGLTPANLRDAAGRIRGLATARDLVLVEGAGGLLVRYDEDGTTIADLAGTLRAPVLVVVAAGLGTLNHTALTIEALAARGLHLSGVVIGSWPREPDIAMRNNVGDLETIAGRPLSGVLPDGMSCLSAAEFRKAAHAGMARPLGGGFDPAGFRQVTEIGAKATTSREAV